MIEKDKNKSELNKTGKTNQNCKKKYFIRGIPAYVYKYTQILV